MAAITDKGFERPTYDDILTDMIRDVTTYFGGDIDTSEVSFLGKLIRIPAYRIAQLYEEMEGVYFARFPHYADGVNLDRLMPFANIVRNSAVAAVHTVEFTGEASYTIEAGFLVAAQNGVPFETNDDFTIGESGTVQATVVCTERGTAGNVPPHSITVIVNSDYRVESVQHVGQVAEGQEEESDYRLRQRFEAVKEGGGAATVNAIRAGILTVPGVVGAAVTENVTDGVVGGIPAHSFVAYVHTNGTATAQDIGGAIFEKKAAGIKAHGAQIVTVQDDIGRAHEVGFEWVTQVPVYVQAEVAVNGAFPPDGAEQIADVVAQRINRESIGSDVIYAGLVAVIYGVTGVSDVNDLRLSVNGTTWVRTNIAVSGSAAAIADRAHIQVTSVPYVDTNGG